VINILQNRRHLHKYQKLNKGLMNMKMKIHINLKKCIYLCVILINVKAFCVETKQIVIESDGEQKSENSVNNQINEVTQNEKKIHTQTLELQNKLISRAKDKMDIGIYLISSKKEKSTNYGIIQLTASMNNEQVVNYDHPLLFENEQIFPLFVAPLALGDYEFKINAIVGQQVSDWPFVLPEGKWSIEKKFKITAHEIELNKKIYIQLSSDEKTSLPKLELQIEDKKI
jgi:hypothetical protein